ncbi:MAG TPA: hypothetical protein VIX59_06420 [Candidatus Binataceae bacterium]
MTLNAGILVIGSLYWGIEPHRIKWRKARLDLNGEFYVSAPIRYGRKSCKRSNTYTMVFSQLCQRNNEWGQAIVIPCQQQPMSSYDHLILEAKQLWWAEQSNDPGESDVGVAKNWGCVALLINPKGQGLPPAWHDEWRKTVHEAGQPYGRLKCATGEIPIVDASGFLKIDWPKTVDSAKSSQLQALDLLLATANEPCLVQGQYPTPETVANAWIKAPKEARYFRQNQKYGIETFQDKSINALLSAAGVP